MKRKPEEEDDPVVEEQEDEEDQDEDDGERDSEDQELIDVDFDFFDPKEIDFHGLKTLVKQTFANDADEFDVSGIADAILAQPWLGSVVKADGADDPYAVMTTLSLSPAEQGGKLGVPMAAVKDYLLKKSKKSNESHDMLVSLLDSKNVGLLLHERLINMPPQLSVPLLKMLIEELEWSVEEKKMAKPFEYLLFISKTYTEVEPTSNEDDEAGPIKKKKKKGKQVILHFQQEDEVVERFAEFQFDYHFSNQNDHAELLQTAGIKTARRAYILKTSKLQSLHDAIKEFTQ
ncbi:p21-C-terminal region-binding protein-domain-containing protein [Chytriomyces sp. MP71]|nr:p21-C-terminal region-binding protein-domain-containing protein [Chytriomyces sp. MP71]